MFCNPYASSWKYKGPLPNPAVSEFHRRLPDHNITPLIPLPALAKEFGLGHVFVKDESNRFGLPAFKILGASWAIFKIIATRCGEPPESTLEKLGRAARAANIQLITCTEGNWGRAVSRMAKYFEIPVTVYVPKPMDRATQDKIASEGAKVVVVDGDYDKSIEMARKEAESDNNNILVMDTSWAGYEEIPQWVVEGYSTMLTETEDQLRRLGVGATTHAIASVGVGSWAQAVTMHYKSKYSPASVITVEPETAACFMASLEAGKITSITTGHTIMSGMNCGTVSYIAWDVLLNGVDVNVQVSDLEADHDLRYLHSQGIENGPCGAAPLSALRKLVQQEKVGLGQDSVVVLFSTEGARSYDVPT